MTLYVPINELLVGLDRQSEVILVLRAYFDESGKLKDPREHASAIGGCIATERVWTQLEPKWMSILTEFHATALHMNNLESATGEFDGWDDAKKDKFKNRLLDAMQELNEHEFKPIGAVVPLETFKALDSAFKVKLQDPYFICLEDSILLAAMKAKELFGEHGYVEIMCDRERQFRSKALIVYDLCESDIRFGNRLAAIGFGRMDRVIPLQVADLIAHSLLQIGRSIVLGTVDKTIIESPPLVIRRLLAHWHCDFTFEYTINGLIARAKRPKRLE